MDDMLALTRDFPEIEYAPGEVVITEGGESTGVWILVSGSLRVTKNGREVNRVSQPGALIGEMSILLGVPDSATVEAAERCVMRYAADGEALLTALDEGKSELSFVITRSLGRLGDPAALPVLAARAWGDSDDSVDAARVEAALAAVPTSELVRWKRHQVKSGEAISVIANRYNTTVSALRSANNLRSNTIRAGQYLMIPVATKPLSAYSKSADARLAKTQNRERAANKIEHVVANGERFWTISQRYGVTTRQLAAWNGMAPRLLPSRYTTPSGRTKSDDSRGRSPSSSSAVAGSSM